MNSPTTVLPGITGLFCDLEDTLVDTVYIDTERLFFTKMYRPIEGAIPFLDRAVAARGEGCCAVVSSAHSSNIAAAFMNTLKQHPAIRLGDWCDGVNKSEWKTFNERMNLALLRRSKSAHEVCFIDDDPYVALNALRYGFGQVILVGNQEISLDEAISSLEPSVVGQLEKALQTQLFIVDHLGQVYFNEEEPGECE